jgi:hypothetical protein
MSIMEEPMCGVAWPSAPLPSVRLRRAPTTIGRNADITPIRLAIEFARHVRRLVRANEVCPNMEREPDHNYRIGVASRLYNALCAQYPDWFTTLFDENGVRVAAFKQPDAPMK